MSEKSSSLRLPAGAVSAALVWALGCGPAQAPGAVPGPTPASPAALSKAAPSAEGEAAPSPPTDPAPPTDKVPLTLRWTFDAGAPVVGVAALGPNGTTYLATAEGYVHALTAEGAYAWSYTVAGIPASEPVLSSDQRTLFVATRSGRVYALEPSGRARWVFHWPIAITSPLIEGKDGSLFFISGDHLCALTPYGALSFRAALPKNAVAGPFRLGEEIGVSTEAGSLELVRTPWQRRRLGLEGNVQSVIETPEGQWAMVVDGRLEVRKPAGTLSWRGPGARYVAATASGLVSVSESGRLSFWDSQGHEETALELRAEPSAPPVVLPDQSVWLPSSRGELLGVSGAGILQAARLGSAPLNGARLSSEERLLVVAGGDGRVAAFTF